MQEHVLVNRDEYISSLRKTQENANLIATPSERIILGQLFQDALEEAIEVEELNLEGKNYLYIQYVNVIAGKYQTKQ